MDYNLCKYCSLIFLCLIFVLFNYLFVYCCMFICALRTLFHFFGNTMVRYGEILHRLLQKSKIHLLRHKKLSFVFIFQLIQRDWIGPSSQLLLGFLCVQRRLSQKCEESTCQHLLLYCNEALRHNAFIITQVSYLKVSLIHFSLFLWCVPWSHLLKQLASSANVNGTEEYLVSRPPALFVPRKSTGFPFFIYRWV